jgi:hypothetical protein
MPQKSHKAKASLALWAIYATGALTALENLLQLIVRGVVAAKQMMRHA